MFETKTTFLPLQLQNLSNLGKDSTLDMKPVILRVAVDLFINTPHHDSDGLQQFCELCLQLIPQVDDATLAGLSLKLARHPQTPQAALALLQARGGGLAEIIVQHGVALSHAAMSKVAQFGSEPLAIALARRAFLPEDISHALAKRLEADVTRALAENSTATFNRAAIELLVRSAAQDPDLAKNLIRHLAGCNDFSGGLATLFFAASPSQRDTIILWARRRDLGKLPQPLDRSHETEASHLRLERHIRGDNVSAAIITLAQMLHCESRAARRLFEDPCGDALAIGLAAIGLPREAAVRIFLSLPAPISENVAVVYRLAGLVTNLMPRTAARLISAMLGLPARRLELSAPRDGGLARMGRRLGLAQPTEQSRDSTFGNRRLLAQGAFKV